MLAAWTLISIEEYLASGYELDCDSVDGHIKLAGYLLGRYEKDAVDRDSLSRGQDEPHKERFDDYLAMGVPYVWVLDSQTAKASQATSSEVWREVKDGVLRRENPVLEVPLAQIFR